MPRWVHDERNRSETARKILGLPDDAMRAHPRVRHLFAKVQGGWEACLEALAGDDTDDALLFLDKYDSISPSDLTRLTVEEIAVAAGLTPRRLFEVVSGALLARATDMSKMIVASAQPAVVEVTARMAQKEGSYMDRETFHKATGFLPTPKGNTVNFAPVTQIANVLPNGQLADGNGAPALPPSTADAFLLEMQQGMRPKAFPLAPTSTAPIGAPDVLEGEMVS